MSEDALRRSVERLETKVDHMSDMLVSLARMEEKTLTLFKRMDRYESEMRDISKRVSEIDRAMIGRGNFFRWMDRGALAFLSTAAAILATWVLKGK